MVSYLECGIRMGRRIGNPKTLPTSAARPSPFKQAPHRKPGVKSRRSSAKLTEREDHRHATRAQTDIATKIISAA